MRVAQLVDALEDREHAAQAEQHERDDERVEVAHRPVAERMPFVGRPVGAACGRAAAGLVPGVGQRVDRLRQHRRRARDEERDELHHRDAEVREERGDDRPRRIAVLLRPLLDDPAAASSPRRRARGRAPRRSSACGACTISRIDLPGARRLLDDLGGRLVAEVRAERGADRRRRLRVRLQACRRWPRCRRRTCRRTPRHALASRSIDSSRLRAITGTNTLSSKLPCEPRERDRRRRCRSPARRPA